MFHDRLAARAAAVRTLLQGVLDPRPDLPLIRGMRHALSGGKGLRGFLVLESAALYDVSAECARWAAAAVEAIHAYSLVHDDLPCMDDADLRRGQSAVHVRWDEATAVLVGDALHCLAFELLTTPELTGDDSIRVTLIAGLARAAGAGGMVLGQAQDLAAETASTPLTSTAITELQANKTGALIGWSAAAGAVLGGGDPAPMQRYADALGLAFQIADDILDVEGNSAAAGKRLHKDAAAGKATFVALLGMDGAKAHARELAAKAEAALDPFGLAADPLRHCARFAISRRI